MRNDRFGVENIPGIPISTRKICSTYASDKIKPWCYVETDLDEIEIDEVEYERNRDASICKNEPNYNVYYKIKVTDEIDASRFEILHTAG